MTSRPMAPIVIDSDSDSGNGSDSDVQAPAPQRAIRLPRPVEGDSQSAADHGDTSPAFEKRGTNAASFGASPKAPKSSPQRLYRSPTTHAHSNSSASLATRASPKVIDAASPMKTMPKSPRATGATSAAIKVSPPSGVKHRSPPLNRSLPATELENEIGSILSQALASPEDRVRGAARPDVSKDTTSHGQVGSPKVASVSVLRTRLSRNAASALPVGQLRGLDPQMEGGAAPKSAFQSPRDTRVRRNLRAGQDRSTSSSPLKTTRRSGNHATYPLDNSLERGSPGVDSQKSPSIGTPASPLVHRGKQRAQESLSQTRQPSEVQPTGDGTPTVEDLEESLRRFGQDLKGEVAIATRVFLEEAKQVNKSAPNNFMSKVSPWAAVKGLQPQSRLDAAGSIIAEIETKVSGKATNHKPKPSKFSTIAGKYIKDTVPKVPKYSSLTIVKRNFLVADDEVLRYVPYFKDTEAKGAAGHKRLVKDIEEAYTNVELTKQEAELVGQIRGYLNSWLAELVDLKVDEQILQRHILQRQCHNLKKNDRMLSAILGSLGGPLQEDIARRASNFATAFHSVFHLELRDVVLPDSHIRELAKKLEGEPVDSLPTSRAVFSTFSQWMCLVCGVAYCQVHGDYTHSPIYQAEQSSPKGDDAADIEYEYNYQPLGLNYADLLLAHEIRTADSPNKDNKSRKDLRPCTNTCYLSSDADDQYIPWLEEKVQAMEEFLVIFTKWVDQSCLISAALDMPCWQVHREIRKSGKRGGGGKDTAEEQQSRKTHDRPHWYNNEKKTLSHNWDEHTTAHLHEERTQLDPCAHEGPCNNDTCPCFAGKILCERMCGCSDRCGRRFTGCNCSPDADGVCCTMDSCICLQMNRECGPDCISCCALDRINPRNKYNDELFATGCRNIVLQRGVPKRLVIGESTLKGVGFGAYLAEPAMKGDYLGEYTGEVISYEESERRAIIYERKHSSFLFDLNSEWAIDAARQGNKTRFINHAQTAQEGLNCVAKVVFANGEHRIKFIALRPIKTGEELLFNYGKKFSERHFNDKLETVSSKKNGGVLVGRAALDALDGLNAENRASRKKLAAIRGGQGGGPAGRGKARKTAVVKKSSRAAELSVYDPPDSDVEPPAAEDVGDEEGDGEEASDDEPEEEEEEEDDDEDNSQYSRPRREIRQPKRYTR